MSHPRRIVRCVATALAPFESELEEIVRERKEIDAAEAAWLAKVAEYAVSGGVGRRQLPERGRRDR